MGASESKAGTTSTDIISYKDALARFDACEIKMIEDAVRRFGTDGSSSSSVHRQKFVQCCLRIVPVPFQNRVYQIFGGSSKSITMVEIYCGLAVFLKGTVEERKRFVFGLYDFGNAGLLSREGLMSALLPGDDKACVELAFAKSPTMDYNQFDSWMSENPTATGWIEWIMFPSRTHYTQELVPTDIDILTQMTHFSRSEAIGLEKRYFDLKQKFQGKGKKLAAASLLNLACPPLTPSLLSRLCYLWGERDGGELEFREVLFGVSTICRGESLEVLKYIFKIFDIGNKKNLRRSDLTGMFNTINELEATKSSGNRGIPDPSVSWDEKRTLSLCSVTSKEEFEAADVESDEGIDEVSELPADGSDPFHVNGDWKPPHSIAKLFEDETVESLSEPEFLEWAANNMHLFGSMKVALAVVGQTVFALRPRTPEEERRIVQNQMQDDHKRQVMSTPGAVCSIVATSWFQSWKEYVGIERRLSNSSGSSSPGADSGPAAPSEINNYILFGRTGLSDVVSSRGSMRHKAGPGGLRKGLLEDKDYVVLSDTVFSMFHHWYGGGPVVDRPVVAQRDGEVRVELYPLNIKVLHHQQSKMTAIESKQPGAKMPNPTFLLSIECSRGKTVQHLAKLICLKHKSSARRGDRIFKANSVRLWHFGDSAAPTLLESEECLSEIEFEENLTVLLEARNEDMSWPSELLALAKAQRSRFSIELMFGTNKPRELGVTGLSNLGNTCFMNAALQCTSNTEVLREYFRRKCYLLEVNETNKMGMKGALARRYGELIERLWSGKTSAAPYDMRNIMIKYASQFDGYQQHDSQELLACLLDGLHEDLNRVKNPPYVERKDSDGRPDHIVAAESWEAHLKRAQSIIVDLFQGQLKSRLRCKACQFESVSFDPFTFLTLPLPTDDTSVVDVVFARLEGDAQQCSIRCGRTATLEDIKLELQKLYACDPLTVVFVEFPGLNSEHTLDDKKKIRMLKSTILHAYELEVKGGITEATGSVGEADSPKDSIGKKKITTCKGAHIPNHCFAIHRKEESYLTHFLTDTSRYNVFGTPLLVPHKNCSNEDLYQFVWKRVRFMMDSDYRSQVEAGHKDIPFVLSQLDSSRKSCSKCSWGRFCQGCAIPNSKDPYSGTAAVFGIDWNPRELCLHGNMTKSANIEMHPSVEKIREEENRPIDLAACLTDYTKEEDMGKDDLWYCPKCKEHVEATKKLDVWSLPPVLIIHLKRFQMVNGRWIKSQRQVKFPVEDFDVFKHIPHPKFDNAGDITSHGDKADQDEAQDSEALDNEVPLMAATSSALNVGDQLVTDNSSMPSATIVEGIENLDPQSKFYMDPKCSRIYDLTAMTIHLGIMGGGHYVAYGKNPNGKWYYFNDSSCKIASDERVKRENGYFLFYTARGLESDRFMPEGTPPQPEDSTSPYQSDGEGSDDGDRSKNCIVS